MPTLVSRAEDESVLGGLFHLAREVGEVLTPPALNILWLAVVFALVFETIKLFFWLVGRLLMRYVSGTRLRRGSLAIIG
jgi:hypothetical protein